MYTKRKVCSLTGLPMSTLERWMESGLICPAIPGQRGRGHKALFSDQQLLGLAVIQALRVEKGCGVSYAVEVYDLFGSMSEAELDGWLSDYAANGVDWGEEVAEGFQRRSVLEHPALFKKDAGDDATTATSRRVMARIRPVEMYLRQRRGIPEPSTPRVSEPKSGPERVQKRREKV